MNKHSLASRLEAVYVWMGWAGGCGVQKPVLLGSNTAPDGQRASRRALAAWQCCRERRDIFDSPIVAAPMAQALTEGAGALLPLDQRTEIRSVNCSQVNGVSSMYAPMLILREG